MPEAIPTLLDRLLDGTIFFSFDRSGFRRHARHFGTEDLAVDLKGRICLVTGANSGIGRATASALASRGAEVWLLCRSEERGREAEQALRKETGNPKVHLAIFDISDLKSVRAFCEGFPREKIDVLVHNAGVLPDRRIETAEGLELTFATHVAGPFLMNHLLAPRLRASGARIVFVVSGGMYAAKLKLEDPDWQERDYDGVAAYAQTKRMQVVLTELLARRFRGTGVTVNAMHPGWAETPAVRSSLPSFFKLMKNRLRTPAEGADTVVWLAIADSCSKASGKLWFDRAQVKTHLLPFTRESKSERRRLWNLCERASGLRGDAPGKEPR
jgi:NAD(P)-dependent dehydrogenase (short-subunit alcohol dehydrogenase family)